MVAKYILAGDAVQWVAALGVYKGKVKGIACFYILFEQVVGLIESFPASPDRIVGFQNGAAEIRLIGFRADVGPTFKEGDFHHYSVGLLKVGVIEELNAVGEPGLQRAGAGEATEEVLAAQTGKGEEDDTGTEDEKDRGDDCHAAKVLANTWDFFGIDVAKVLFSLDGFGLDPQMENQDGISRACEV